MPPRNRLVATIFIALVIGSIGLNNMSRSGRFEAYRSVDVLQLLGSGMCFGVALVALIMLIRKPRTP